MHRATSAAEVRTTTGSAGVLPEVRPILEARGLTARYGRIQVLFGVDMVLHQGELVVLLGANGAGKTSFLKALAGIVDSEGEIRLKGALISGLPAHGRARIGVALVPEVRGNLFRSMTVNENLQVALRQLSRERQQALLANVFQMFPLLKERFHTTCAMLSGGEQQMLAVAVALGREPAVLLLDEPTQGLAPSIHDVLIAVFSHLRGSGISIILAEQNLPFASRCANRFVVFAGGRVTLEGSGEQIADRNRIMAAYLGT